VKVLDKIGNFKSTLLVVDIKDDAVVRATRNVQGLKVVQAQYLNVYDILNTDMMIMTEKSVEIITAWLAVTKKAPAKEGK
jgi:large subunit ribosomal protein L4